MICDNLLAPWGGDCSDHEQKIPSNPIFVFTGKTKFLNGWTHS